MLFMAGLLIGFLIKKCAAWQSHLKPRSMRKRVKKSQAILALLDTFQELGR